MTKRKNLPTSSIDSGLLSSLLKISEDKSKSSGVNVNSKSGLAKLMAAENLDVIHDPKMTTAAFDLKTRTVYLPIMKDMTGYMYDAFIAHEISHALYTPDSYTKFEKKTKIPTVFLNITEDVRIEKLIKRKYPGTKKDFHHFYKTFHYLNF